MAKFTKDLARQWKALRKRDQILLGVLGTAGATVIVGSITYALLDNSPWPNLRDPSCPFETYETILGAHNVSDPVIERAWTYMPLVRYAAAQWGIDPALLAGLVHTESNWNPQAGSSAGAIGLGQVIPSTAAAQFRKLRARGQWPFPKLSSSNDPQSSGKLASEDVAQWVDRTDPRQSVWLAASLLAGMLDDHSLEWTLAAYNGGPGVANDPVEERPVETQNYVPSVIKHRGWYRELEQACGSVVA